MEEQKKSILVIGATSGMGREVAEIYIRRGYRVGITGRREHLLNEIKDKYPDAPVFAKCVDVTSAGATEEIGTLINEMGGIDICLYSSGCGHTNTALSPSVELEETSVNVNGYIRCSTFLFNYWSGQRRKGHLAVISSIASVRPLGVAPGYSADKKFQAFYTEALRQLAVIRKADIAFTVIKPGFVDTDFIHGRRFPMTISREKAAGLIVKAIDKRKRAVIIDRKWAALSVLMRLVPPRLWTSGGRFFRPYTDLF